MLPRDVTILAVDSTGALVASDGARRLARLVGGWLSDVAPLPEQSRATSLCLLPNGGVAVADAGLHRIWRLDASGRLGVLAGVEQPPDLARKPTRSDGPLSEARFRSPSAIVSFPSGELLVAEDVRNLPGLRLVDDRAVTTVEWTDPLPRGFISMGTVDGTLAGLAAGGPLGLVIGQIRGSLWARTAVVGSLNDRGAADGPMRTARFVAPVALSAAEDGWFVADGARVRSVDRGLNVRTVAGGLPGFADGPGSSAQFGPISAIAAGPDGRVFVADPDNDAIRVVAAEGDVSTIIGTLRSSRISADEAGLLAKSFGNALIDGDVREAWGLARMFLRDHRLGAEPWPDRTIQPTSVASARLGKELAVAWSIDRDPDRSRVGLYCLWLIGCEERALGVNEIRDHRLIRAGEDLDRQVD